MTCRASPTVACGFILSVALVLFSPTAAAQEVGNCWVAAGKKYNIDPWLLYSIGQVESDLDPNAINQNKDSIDRGIMQINSFWEEPLQESGVTIEHLFNPCISIHIGAWILKDLFRMYGKTWEAVGAYNAGTAKTEEARRKRQIYSEKVKKRYNENRAN